MPGTWPMSNIDAAFYYRDKFNFSVIPLIPGDKKPLIKWEEYQKRRASNDEIRQWFCKEPKANLGIVTGSISGIGVIDIDTEEGQRNIDCILPDTFLTPMQHTPRGGRHLVCIINNKINNNSNVIRGCDFRGEGGYICAAPSVSSKNGKPYFWDEGINLENTELAPIPEAYLNAISVVNGRQGVVNGPQASSSVVMFKSGTRDNDLFHVANHLIKSRMPIEEVSQVLSILAANCNPPFPEKEIQIKIKSAIERAEKRERNLAQEVREWVLSSNGVFLSSEVAKCLQVSSRDEQKNLSKVLTRLANDGIIEKYGNKNGCYRVIDDELQEIDVFNTHVNPVNIYWPLGVEAFVDTHPKSLIVVAGEPNSGKTAYLLNVAMLNMNQMPTYYFSSEMGAMELKSRLTNFEMPMSSWKKLKFYERSDNFADVVKPDALNIIDFLEVHDDFWKIGGMMKAIFDKLRNGVAVIAIQKPKGRDEGVGGQRGLEKPRLYMSMEPGKIKIVKGKNWVNPVVNPNGMEVAWKLIKGCKFLQSGNWVK